MTKGNRYHQQHKEQKRSNEKTTDSLTTKTHTTFLSEDWATQCAKLKNHQGFSRVLFSCDIISENLLNDSCFSYFFWTNTILSEYLILYASWSWINSCYGFPFGFYQRHHCFWSLYTVAVFIFFFLFYLWLCVQFKAKMHLCSWLVLNSVSCWNSSCWYFWVVTCGRWFQEKKGVIKI